MRVVPHIISLLHRLDSIRIRYLILSLIFPLCSVSAQWVKIANNIVSGPNFGAICYKDNYLWAGHFDLFVSSDTGRVWTKVLTVGNNDPILSIDFLDSVNGVVKTLNQTYVTNTKGTTWRSYNQVGYSACFLGSPSSIAYIGNSGAAAVICITTNGGTTWATTYSEAQTKAASFYLQYRGSGTIIANAGAHLLFSTDYGQSWSVKKDSAVLLDSWSFAADPCGKRNELLLVSEDIGKLRTFGTILRTTDEGMTWKTSVNRIPLSLCGSIVRNAQSFFYQTTDSGIYRSSDGGASWKNIGGPSAQMDTRLLATVGNSVLIAGDKNGNIWRSNIGLPKISPDVSIALLEFIVSLHGCASDSTQVVFTGKLCHRYKITAIDALGPDAGLLLIGQNALPISLGLDMDTVRVRVNRIGYSGLSLDSLRIRLVDEEDGTSHDTLIAVSDLIVVKPPKLLSSPPSVLFDSTDPCDFTKDTIITLRNIGCDTVRILSGPGPLTSGVSIDPLVFPIILPVDSTITLNVRFHPIVKGLISTAARFSVQQQDSLGEITIALSGTGTGTAPGLRIRDSIISVGLISKCLPVRDTEVTLYNSGCDTITIGSNPTGLTTNFTIDPFSLPVGIPPKDSVTVRIHFRSNTSGIFKCVVTIVGTRPGITDTLRLHLIGQNIGTPGLTVADSSIDFNTVSLCSASRDTTVRFVNTSCDTIRITSGLGAISNSFSTDVIPLPIVIPPGGSIDIVFHFHPVGVGTFHVKAVISEILLGQSQSVIIDLLGRAVASVPTPVVAFSTVNFDSVSICSPTGKDTLITFRNGGCDTLKILSASGMTSGAFSMDPILFPLVLPPDSSVGIVFHFTPNVVGSFTASPSFDAERTGGSERIDLTLQGDATAGSSIFSTLTPSLTFAPVSICATDSAEIVYTNIGCDTLFVTAHGYSGDTDFSAVTGQERAVIFGDTIHVKVWLKPLQKGVRSGSYTLRIRRKDGATIDTLIPLSVVVTEGQRLLSCSVDSIDFGVNKLCFSTDTTIVIKNIGCDTLTISDAALLGNGFTVTDAFPIVIPPAGSTTFIIKLDLDTLGHKFVSTAILRITSNSSTPVSDIPIIQRYDYPKTYHLHIVVDSLRATRDSIVPIRVIADSLPSGLTSITGELTVGSSDLLSYIDYQSSNTIVMNNGRFTITGNPIVAPNGVLAELHYLVSLTAIDSTDITFSDAHFNTTDIEYERCIASVTANDTMTFFYRYVCGEAFLSRVLRGEQLLRILGVHPNPTTTDISIDIESKEKTEVTVIITDVTGKKVDVFTGKVSVGSGVISRKIGSFPSGRYFIELTSKNERVVSTFIKQQ